MNPDKEKIGIEHSGEMHVFRKRRSVAAAIQKEVLIEFRKHTDITFTDVNTTNITLTK